MTAPNEFKSCPECEGTGIYDHLGVPPHDPCPECIGTGVVPFTDFSHLEHQTEHPDSHKESFPHMNSKNHQHDAYAPDDLGKFQCCYLGVNAAKMGKKRSRCLRNTPAGTAYCLQHGKARAEGTFGQIWMPLAEVFANLAKKNARHEHDEN